MKTTSIKSWRIWNYAGLDSVIAARSGLEYAASLLLLVAFTEMLTSGRHAWVRDIGFFGLPPMLLFTWWRAVGRMNAIDRADRKPQ